MKMFVLTAIFILLTGCATVQPEEFSRRCIAEGYNLDSGHHEACTKYYADAHTKRARQERWGRIADALQEADAKNQSDDLHCTKIDNQIFCERW